MIIENYHFTVYNPKTPPKYYDKICFILHGFNKYSTKLKIEDFYALDVSDVKYKPFKELIIKYVLSAPSMSILTGRGDVAYIKDGLNFISLLKEQTDYPTPLNEVLKNQEAVFLRNYIVSMNNISLNTKNHRLSAIKYFLQWCKERGFMIFDSMFFDYLMSLGNSNKNTAESIPDEELSKIISFTLEDAKKNHTAKICYVIIRLLLETKFRCNTICKLQTDSIVPTEKPNQYRLINYHKTGNGSPEYSIINETTRKLLIDMMESTEDLREESCVTSKNIYIFLQRGDIRNNVGVFCTTRFSEYLRGVCRKLSIKEYTAENFRDTHMTKSLEFLMRNNKNIASMNILTGHKHIDTTNNHYIDWKLEEMLEATYGIDFGNNDYLNQSFNIVDSIPDEYNNVHSIVENGCGNCLASECKMTSTLPCLICKDFITTIAHQSYYEKEIERIQKLIDGCNGTKHDVEDLIVIKKLYVMYLGQILQRKEEIKNE